ncbi:hypothetical protein SETIT_7G115700v2 [Setaria italica]|uniref:Uncharacterized protein n=1 Tax=Setaria italica TaxID=4555 RepID=A0A368RUN9_SETIT|nr:hypothetical protein SETIT_7G115700v2 [Setaria italica]RCV33846.1 hypothetical protein SETIT_7G115700v2 [Setaria italica]
MNCNQPQRKRTGKMPPALYAWSVHMMLCCSFVLLIAKVAGHTCVVPIINIPTVFDLFKNAYSRDKPACDVLTAVAPTNQKPKAMLLACPICRGEVKGWTVVKPARRFLNRKRRTCMHEDCSFVGTYKRLKKHVKSRHRSSKPREVDPVRLAEWEEFENEKERQDAISIVSALNPGSIIMGDYIIDPNSDSDNPYSNDTFDSDMSLDGDPYSDDTFDSDMSLDGDEGSYHRDFVHRERAHRRNRERASQSLRRVGVSGIRCSVPRRPRMPFRVGFVRRSVSQPSELF